MTFLIVALAIISVLSLAWGLAEWLDNQELRNERDDAITARRIVQDELAELRHILSTTGINVACTYDEYLVELRDRGYTHVRPTI
jgi:hypothetical protein